MLFPFFGPLSNKLWVKVRYPINIYIYRYTYIHIKYYSPSHLLESVLVEPPLLLVKVPWVFTVFDYAQLCWLRVSPFLLTISWLSLVLTPVLLVTIYKVLVPPCFFLQSPTHVNCLVPALLLGISCDIHCWCWLGSTSCFGSCMFLFSFPFLVGEAPDFPPHLPQS